MVTKKELADFKESLTSALQKAGYTAFGRISSSETMYNFYAHLPEQEMVALYVEDNNLDEINRVYRIIKYIDEHRGESYSLKTLCYQHDIDYSVFNHAVENLSYIDKTGERSKTQYHWIHTEEPSFITAKNFVEHMRLLRATKLNKTLKMKISQAVAKGMSKDDFLKANNIRKGATYKVEAYYNYQKVQQQKKEGAVSDSEPENTPEPENSSVSETELQDPGSPLEVSVLKDQESLSSSERMDETGLQMENYILRQEIRYLKKINKAKDKLIKGLRKKVK